MSVTEPRNSKHVLLVEDELLVAMHVQTLLEDLDFDDVHWANSIEAAERDLAARTPRFAVLDINVGPKLVFSGCRGTAAQGRTLHLLVGQQP